MPNASGKPRFKHFERVVMPSGKLGTVASYACTPSAGFLYAVSDNAGSVAGKKRYYFKENELQKLP